MNNKNWSDRADRDLFFTILSVKNIGVISGSEWVTIGNYMRGLGYGFTNEGCRQHFQGLRRAQNKSDQNGSPGAGPARRSDPTTNPITRRPGPGRGRPKKSNGEDAMDGSPSDSAPIEDMTLEAGNATEQPNQSPNAQFHPQYQQPQPGQHPASFPHHGQHSQWPGPQSSPYQPEQRQPPPPHHPQQHQVQQQQQQQQQQLQPHPQPQHLQHQQLDPKLSQSKQQQSPPISSIQPTTYVSPQPPPAQLQRDAASTAPGQTESGPPKPTTPAPENPLNVPKPLPLESENGDDDDDDDDDDADDDRPSKRQKTEDEDAEGDGNLEDDPVLALASAENGGSGNSFTSELVNPSRQRPSYNTDNEGRYYGEA